MATLAEFCKVFTDAFADTTGQVDVKVLDSVSSNNSSITSKTYSTLERSSDNFLNYLQQDVAYYISNGSTTDASTITVSKDNFLQLMTVMTSCIVSTVGSANSGQYTRHYATLLYGVAGFGGDIPTSIGSPSVRVTATDVESYMSFIEKAARYNMEDTGFKMSIVITSCSSSSSCSSSCSCSSSSSSSSCSSCSSSWFVAFYSLG